jgi:hypothetical protein
MITIVLVVAAIYALAGQQIIEKARSLFATSTLPSVDGKHVAFAALIAAAAISWFARPSDAPPPAPDNPAAFSLRGKFVGPTAADDAAIVSSLCEAIGDAIEYDAAHDKRLKTGVAFDELRVFARELRMRGESIGDRQPQARDAISEFLDDAVGASGGPVTDESRTAWVNAFREIGRAAGNVAR